MSNTNLTKTFVLSTTTNLTGKCREKLCTAATNKQGSISGLFNFHVYCVGANGQKFN